MNPGYVPSLPHGIPNPNVSGNNPGGLAWTPTPSSSHIWGFRYYDVRLHGFLRKFPGAIGAGRSELHVIFRDSNTNGPVSYQYTYFFADPDAGQAIADRLGQSPHPYGLVLYPDVIKGGIPYTRA